MIIDILVGDTIHSWMIVIDEKEANEFVNKFAVYILNKFKDKKYIYSETVEQARYTNTKRSVHEPE